MKKIKVSIALLLVSCMFFLVSCFVQDDYLCFSMDFLIICDNGDSLIGCASLSDPGYGAYNIGDASFPYNIYDWDVLTEAAQDAVAYCQGYSSRASDSDFVDKVEMLVLETEKLHSTME